MIVQNQAYFLHPLDGDMSRKRLRELEYASFGAIVYSWLDNNKVERALTREDAIPFIDDVRLSHGLLQAMPVCHAVLGSGDVRLCAVGHNVFLLVLDQEYSLDYTVKTIPINTVENGNSPYNYKVIDQDNVLHFISIEYEGSAMNLSYKLKRISRSFCELNDGVRIGVWSARVNVNEGSGYDDNNAEAY